jgi:hypothetical protein
VIHTLFEATQIASTLFITVSNSSLTGAFLNRCIMIGIFQRPSQCSSDHLLATGIFHLYPSGGSSDTFSFTGSTFRKCHLRPSSGSSFYLSHRNLAPGWSSSTSGCPGLSLHILPVSPSRNCIISPVNTPLLQLSWSRIGSKN